MQLTGNTILITGGATGIGWAIARRFLDAGNVVVACGRRAEALAEAQAQDPRLRTIVADVETAAGREALAAAVVRDYPALNVLINNAGVQHRGTVLEGDWEAHRKEIAINFEAPIHLTMLLMPQLKSQANAAIINVTSGLAFTPLPMAAIYSATKAALHSFSQSLRVQAGGVGVEVIEIVPPAVNTDLGGKGLHTHGVPLEDFGDGVWAGLEAGKPEFGYGSSEERRLASREELDKHVAFLATLRP